MRAIGQWNAAWDPFYDLSPGWTDQFFAFGASLYKSGLFTPRFVELISIAFDASIPHMYAPGVGRHIRGALKAGATPEEIMTVLQICVALGVEACAKGVPILAQELERNSANQKTAEGIGVTAGKGCEVIRELLSRILLSKRFVVMNYERTRTRLKERAISEAKKFAVIVGYLWIFKRRTS